MSHITINTIAFLLLLGVLVFSVGINQSYAQTSQPTTPDIELFLTKFTQIQTIDFSVVTDDTHGFEDIDITFTRPRSAGGFLLIQSGTNILNNLQSGTVYAVTGQTVGFVDINRELHTVTMPYTATTPSGSSTGNIIINYLEDLTITLHDYTFNVPSDQTSTIEISQSILEEIYEINVPDEYENTELEIETDGSHGGTASFHGTPTGTITYTPADNFIGTEQFTLRASNAPPANAPDDTPDMEAASFIFFNVIDGTAPTAEDINIQIVPNSEATISFGDAINDAETEFSDLTISFSFVDTDLTAHQVSVGSGATVVPDSEGGATFTVDAQDVRITETSDSGSSASVPRTITLRYTVSDGEFTSTSTVNIFVVESITTTFDGVLDDRTFTVPASLAVFTTTFDGRAYTTLMNLANTFGLRGSQYLGVTVDIDEIGSHGGTATFTNNGLLDSSFLATLTYTPAEGFDGTETFTYTGTGNDVIASGVFSFIVEAIPNIAPTTEDINIQIVPGTLATLEFGDAISDTHTEFSDLTISFSFDETDLTAHQVSVGDGATVVPDSEGGATFTVDAPNVSITETSGSGGGGPAVPRTITLTYTVSDGEFTSTDKVNIFVVESITSTFDGDLDDRSFTVPASLPVFTTTFDVIDYANLINPVDTFGRGGFEIFDIILSIDYTGSQGGTATFAHNESISNFLATLTYTPTEGFDGTETFTYTGTTDDVVASGTFTFIVEANTAPTTLDIAVTSQPNANGVIDFSGITDDSDSFAELDIEFDLIKGELTNPESNLFFEVAFNTNDATSTDSDTSLVLLDEMLRFTVNPEATLGLYTLEYRATDSGGLESTGNVIFTIREESTLDGDLEDKTFDVPVESLSMFTETFDGAAYANLLNVVDTFGLDEDRVRDITVIINDGSQGGTATFTNNEAPADFLATLTYTPVKGFGGTETFTYTGIANDVIASGTLTFIVESIPNTAPITEDIVVTAEQGFDGFIDFSTIDDDSDMFEDFTSIQFALESSSNTVTNPELDISTQVAFNTNDATLTAGSILLLVNEMLRFTVNDDATPGIYNLEYRVTDSEGRSSTGDVIFTITGIPNTAPTIPDINIQIVPNSEAIISFGDAISDIQTEFSELDIAFSFDDTDLSASQISVTSGATVVDGSTGGSAFDVTAENVVITETSDSSSSASVPRTITLTYTVSNDGVTSTGKVNIFVVESITSTFDGLLDDRTFDVSLESLPEYTATFNLAEYLDLINFNPIFNDEVGIFSVSVTIDATGSQGGTATFTNIEPGADTLATITYTPVVGFGGTETFTYTGTANDVIASGTLTFIVESIPNTAPITEDIAVTAAQGADGEIPFSAISDDSDMMFADFTSVEFDVVNSAVTNPESNIFFEVAFNTNDVTLTAGSTKLLVTSETLRFTVNDDATLGVYTLEYTVTDSEGGTSTGNVIFTIVEPNSAPTAEDIDIQIRPRTVFTISFGDAISDTQTEFSELDIRFSFVDTSLVFSKINIVSGATVVEGSEGGATFDVTGENVRLREISSLLGTGGVGNTYAITYTVSDGEATSTGTVTIIVVAAPVVPLDPNLGLDDRTFNVPTSLSLLVFETTFDSTEFADLLNAVDTFGLDEDRARTITVIINDGSQGGTATFTNNGVFPGFLATLRYTPDEGFIGTETFTYAATNERGTARGTLTFIVDENTAPTTPDIHIQIEEEGRATIPFGDHIADAESSFSRLDISFTKDNNDLAISNIFIKEGISREPGIIFVIDENVVIAEISGGSSGSLTGPRTVELEYTVSDGELESTGTVYVFVVEDILPPLDPNLGLDDRTFNVPASLSPEFETTFNGRAYTTLMNLASTFGLRGSQYLGVTVDIDEIGSHGGTATFTNNGLLGASFLATLTYTPDEGFTGTETFTYAGISNRGIASGVFTFIVEAVTCETSLAAGVEFGELGVGVTSDTSSLSLVNDGNVPVQSLIAGANWLSVEDESISIMDVGQTRYSVTDSDAFDTRTPFTVTPVNVGDDIAESESLDIYLQLFVGLIDESFRGDTTQTMTITSNCSENP